MSVLLIIWLVALALTGLSIAAMVGLMIRRLITQAADRRRARDRGQLQAALIGLVQGRNGARAELAPYCRRARLMAETLLDFLSLVRGNDRELVLSALEDAGVPDVLRDRLRRGSLAGRMAAMEALAAFPSLETERALKAAAGDSAIARLTALVALARAGGAVPISALLDEVTVGDLRASGRFAEFLREQIAADPNAGVRALARTDLKPPVRVLVLEALGTCGDYSVLPALERHTTARDPAVRIAAVQALGRMQHPLAKGSLVRALEDIDPDVRAAAAEAIGGARLTGLAEALGGRLSDTNWRVRFQAAAALGKLGKPGLAQLRKAAAEPGTPSERAAALTLAELGVA